MDLVQRVYGIVRDQGPSATCPNPKGTVVLIELDIEDFFPHAGRWSFGLGTEGTELFFLPGTRTRLFEMKINGPYNLLVSCSLVFLK